MIEMYCISMEKLSRFQFLISWFKMMLIFQVLVLNFVIPPFFAKCITISGMKKYIPNIEVQI